MVRFQESFQVVGCWKFLEKISELESVALVRHRKEVVSSKKEAAAEYSMLQNSTENHSELSSSLEIPICQRPTEWAIQVQNELVVSRGIESKDERVTQRQIGPKVAGTVPEAEIWKREVREVTWGGLEHQKRWQFAHGIHRTEDWQGVRPPEELEHPSRLTDESMESRKPSLSDFWEIIHSGGPLSSKGAIVLNAFLT
jgi:hypothetical protein